MEEPGLNLSPPRPPLAPHGALVELRRGEDLQRNSFHCLDWHAWEEGGRRVQEHMVFVLGERYCLLVAVYHMLVEERAVLDEVARVAVCLGPLADDGRRHVVELARQALRLEEAAEVVPEASIVVPQCRRELVGCAIPLPASLVGGGVDEVASVELAAFSEAAERRV